jgi:hypothetical protein
MLIGIEKYKKVQNIYIYKQYMHYCVPFCNLTNKGLRITGGQNNSYI